MLGARRARAHGALETEASCIWRQRVAIAPVIAWSSDIIGPSIIDSSMITSDTAG